MQTLVALADRVECMRIRPLLQPFLDGALTDRQAARIARHVDACQRCGLSAETYGQIKAGLARLASPPDPAAVTRLQRFVDELADSER